MSNDVWFKAKRYGWGWSPSTWQGWLSTLIYAVLTVLPAVAFEVWVDAYLWVFVAYVSLLSGVFIFLCYQKGEKPEWRWGDKE